MNKIYNLNKKYEKKLTKLSTLILLIITVFSGLFFSNNTEQKHKYSRQENNLTPKYEGAFPYDFFGDYSHPEFWYDPSDWYHSPVEYKYPDHVATGWLHSPEYIGNGISSFTKYTKSYNKYLFDNPSYSDSKYVGEYNNFVTNSDNINGFLSIDPDWTLLSVSYYIEDFVVWNWNVNLKQSSDKNITNDDAELCWEISDGSDVDYPKIDDDPHNWMSWAMKDIVGYLVHLDFHNDYVYFFVDQPTTNQYYYDNIVLAYEYKIYNIDRLLPPSKTHKKYDANNIFDEKETHNYFKKYNYKDNHEEITLRLGDYDYYQASNWKTSGFEFLINNIIFSELNKNTILAKDKGLDFVLAQDKFISSINQSYYTGFISRNDYVVNYETKDSAQGSWKNINTFGEHDHKKNKVDDWIIDYDSKDINLEYMEYLKITINTMSTVRTDASKVSEVFKPRFEWGLGPDPDLNPVPPVPPVHQGFPIWAIMLLFWAAVIVLFLIIILIFIFKEKKKK